MDLPERIKPKSLVPEKEGENRVLLDAIREHLQNDPDVYFAGELTNLKDDEEDKDRFDHHDFFIAPRTPCFDPKELTAFTKKVLAGLNMTFIRDAFMNPSGDMQLPDAFVDQHIGNREIKVTITTKVRKGSFKGQKGKTVKQETQTEKLIQRTTVKVFTDPLFAKTLFDYCSSLVREELEEKERTHLFFVYATHVVPAKYLEALKKHYQESGSNSPQLPPSN